MLPFARAYSVNWLTCTVSKLAGRGTTQSWCRQAPKHHNAGRLYLIDYAALHSIHNISVDSPKVAHIASEIPAVYVTHPMSPKHA